MPSLCDLFKLETAVRRKTHDQEIEETPSSWTPTSSALILQEYA